MNRTTAEHIENFTAMSKTASERTSLCHSGSEIPQSSQSVETWLIAPIGTTTPESVTSPSWSPRSSLGAVRTESRPSFVMSLLTPSSSTSERKSFDGESETLDTLSREERSEEPTSWRRSFGVTPFFTTRFSSSPLVKGHDRGPVTWASEETT